MGQLVSEGSSVPPSISPHQYAALVPADFLERVTARAQTNLASSRIISGDAPQKYNLLCWERAAPYLPASLKTAVFSAIKRTFAAFGPLQDDTFGELNALSFAPTPSHQLAQIAPEIVQQTLDKTIEQQAADSGWWPGWHWDQYEDNWPIAKKEWAGKITADTLLTLKNHNRIEGF